MDTDSDNDKEISTHCALDFCDQRGVEFLLPSQERRFFDRLTYTKRRSSIERRHSMSVLNWVGLVMLVLAFLFMELFLGINTWYDMNTGAVLAAVAYLLVGTTLTLWPNARDKQA
jgi:small-conductance mechanosensitive channel